MLELMESVRGAPPSAGTIRAHNLHLLTGDDERTNTNESSYDAPRPVCAESHSSEDSRQLDQSPCGNQSDDSLEAEMKYQEELKDRLRQSFAELGIHPEGVLRDSMKEDVGLRDSLDEPSQSYLVTHPETNSLERSEGTFVKPLESSNNVEAADFRSNPQHRDSLDANQDDNNNRFENLQLKDSLDSTQDSVFDRNAQSLPGDFNTEDSCNGYPVKEPTIKSNRQLSGSSHHSNNNHGGINLGSRRNSRNSGEDSSKGSANSTHVRLKDSPSQKKHPLGILHDSQISAQQGRKTSGQIKSRNSSDHMKAREIAHPKLPTELQNTCLESGEEVRVEYISDDSGDDDMHFVDEKGSPVDNFGLPLNHKREESSLRREFRIRPTPPKEPNPREQQAWNSRRTTGFTKARHSSGKLVGDTAKTYNEELGMLESSKPPARHRTPSQQEPVVYNTHAEQLGIQDGTLPSEDYVDFNKVKPSSQSRLGRLDSSKHRQNKKLDSSSQSGVSGNEYVTSHTIGSCMDSTTSGKDTKSSPDPHNILHFDMRAIKEAAVKQEAALRFEDIPDTKNTQRSSSPFSSKVKNDGENRLREIRHEQSPRDALAYDKYSDKNSLTDLIHGSNSSRHEQQPQDQYNTQHRDRSRPLDDVSLSENIYHSSHVSSGYSKRDEVHPQYQNYGESDIPLQKSRQSQQGSESSLTRPSVYGGERSANQPPQYDMTQIVQPLTTQETAVEHLQHFQNQTGMEAYPFVRYQPQNNQSSMNPLTGYPPGYSQPMQSAVKHSVATSYHKTVPSNPQHPIDSRFDPNLSGSYHQHNDVYARQSLQQPQQLHQQEEYLQGVHQPIYFNQGGPYQQTGDKENMQQQPQFFEQYQTQQLPSAPPVSDFPMPKNRPYQINQPPQYNMHSYQMPDTQEAYQNQQSQVMHHRPIHSEPSYPHQSPSVRTGPDFINQNKQMLRYGPPKRTYQDLYSIQKESQNPPSPLNSCVPLPSISRENSQEASGTVASWVDSDDESWTKKLVEEQRQMALLMRGQSDTNLSSGLQAFQTYPPKGANLHNYNAHSSWSADHATLYARMQASQKPPVLPRQSKVAFTDGMYNSFESEDELISPKGSNSNRTSSYPALQGTLSQNRERQSPLRTSDPDGYLVKMEKAKQKPQYKEYTLKDYRSLKKDVKLGGLGPDQDMMSEKQDKVKRQRDYAKAVMEQNRKALQQAKNRPWRNTSLTPTRKYAESPSRRNIAIEYAKNVPKPRLPTPPEEVHERLYGSSSRQQEDHQEAVAKEMLRLEELKARHLKEKEDVDSHGVRTE